MERLIELTKLVELSADEFGNLYLTIDKIFNTIAPKHVQRNLKWNLSRFLVLYPMPSKKFRVYKKLDEKKKLSFLIRYLIGTAYREKAPIGLLKLHKELQERIASNKYFFKWEKEKYDELESEAYSSDQIKTLFSMNKYESKGNAHTRLLTIVTEEIIDFLFNKRKFLLHSNPYNFIEHLIEEKRKKRLENESQDTAE
jgi:hypothetical protein